MIGYYDYVLGLIPAALIGVTAFLTLVGLSLTAALPGGALVAFGIMAHAVFVRYPVIDDVRASGERAPERSAGRSVDRSAGQSTTGGAAD